MSEKTFIPMSYATSLANTGNFRISTHQLAEWDGCCWQLISKDDSMRQAFTYIYENEGEVMATSRNAKQAYEAALLYLEPLGKPTEKTVIPVRNGYVHLSASGVSLESHDKALNLRYCINCNYDSLAVAPTKFMEFVERILPDTEVRQRVQEYIGYTLLPDAPHQIAHFWLGTGANGKGVMANIVQALHRRVAAVNLDELDGFSLTEALDASLVYCDEAPQNRISSRTFKMVTAAETVTIKRKYRDPVSAKIKAKWLILGNHIPETTDHSGGFWRRLEIVPFSVTIPPAERDPKLADYIVEHELSGVLNWAIEGALRLQARGRFDPVLPKAMSDAISSAKAESNSVISWWQDTEKVLKSTIDTLKVDVYKTYSGWCKASGLSSLSMPKFWQRVTADIPGFVESRLTTRSGQRPRVCNIALFTR